VPGCNRPAELEVILYDFYLNDGGEVFSEQDSTCPYICAEHAVKNEKQAEGVREPRGSVIYPYTNQNEVNGFTIYRPVASNSALPQF